MHYGEDGERKEGQQQVHTCVFRKIRSIWQGSIKALVNEDELFRLSKPTFVRKSIEHPIHLRLPIYACEISVVSKADQCLLTETRSSSHLGLQTCFGLRALVTCSVHKVSSFGTFGKLFSKKEKGPSSKEFVMQMILQSFRCVRRL